MLHHLVLTLIAIGWIILPWFWWHSWREMRERHRQMLEEMRWRHFEEWMRLGLQIYYARQFLEQDD